MAAIEENSSSRGSREAAEARGSDLQKQVKLLQLEKSDIEATLNLDCKSADETISKLEGEMAEMESRNRDLEEWIMSDRCWKITWMTGRNDSETGERVAELETVGVRSDGPCR